MSLADIQLTDQCLGQGFSGKVYRAILPQLMHRATGSLPAFSPACETPTGTIVALKFIASAGGNGRVVEGCSAPDNDAIVRSALLEARLHARLEHPNLVRLLAVQEARQPVMIALELCEHGALLGVLRERSNSKLDFDGEQRRDMATQVAAGLRYLHSKLCIHRDIAARNVLVAAALADVPPPLCGYTMKLSDLGLARQLRTEEDYYQVRVPPSLVLCRAEKYGAFGVYVAFNQRSFT